MSGLRVPGVRSGPAGALRLGAVQLLLLFVATLVSLPSNASAYAPGLSLAAGADASGWGSLRVHDRLLRARLASPHLGFAAGPPGAERRRGMRAGEPSIAPNARLTHASDSPTSHRAAGFSSTATGPEASLRAPVGLSPSTDEGSAQRALVDLWDPSPTPSVVVLRGCRVCSAGSSLEMPATNRCGASAVAPRAPPARTALVPPPVRA